MELGPSSSAPLVVKLPILRTEGGNSRKMYRQSLRKSSRDNEGLRKKNLDLTRKKQEIVKKKD